MNYPCAMYEKLKASKMVAVLRDQCSQFPDKRTGENSQYELPDAGMSAFSVFFTQTPSFLAHQRDMKLRKGKSNAERLFALDEYPVITKSVICSIPCRRKIWIGCIGIFSQPWNKADCWKSIVPLASTSWWPWMGRNTSVRRRSTARSATIGC